MAGSGIIQVTLSPKLKWDPLPAGHPQGHRPQTWIKLGLEDSDNFLFDTDAINLCCLIPHRVQRVVLCSGKHYYALLKQREASAANQNTALVRVEELCPFPLAALQQELNKYPNAKGRATSHWAIHRPAVWLTELHLHTSTHSQYTCTSTPAVCFDTTLL